MTAPALVILAAGRARRYGGVKPLAPIGPNGEAVIDLLGSDAVAAGFSPIVLVLGPETGPQIRAHVEATWPSSVDVRFCTQERPRGTVDAVRSAAGSVDPTKPFGVANADDLYGLGGLRSLKAHLSAEGSSAVVGYRLAKVVLEGAPVTRGVCEADASGMLTKVTERKQVTLAAGRFSAADGKTPEELEGNALVSMNLWGFAPGMWAELAAAMEAAPEASEDAEVLLPDLVASLIARGQAGEVAPTTSFKVIACEDACVGVTHPEDLGVVQQAVLEQVEGGLRPREAFGGSGA